MSAAGSTRAGDTAPPVQRDAMTAQERDRLRSYIAANIIGDSPPPLTSEARDMIRRLFGPEPGQAGEISAAA